MKKCRFLWSAHRITERQKAGKSRSIKGKQLKNSRNTVSKQLVEHHSSQNVNYTNYSRIYKKKYTAAPEMQCFRGFSFVYVKITGKAAIEAAFCVFRLFLFL